MHLCIDSINKCIECCIDSVPRTRPHHHSATASRMDTTKLKKFAQFARRKLIEEVGAKLTLALAPNSPARRENPQAIKALEKAIAASDPEQVTERVAYVWFNRLCALRFMDANRYTAVGIVSPAEG